MEIQRLDTFVSDIDIKVNSRVKVTEMGNITEIMYCSTKNRFCPIRVLDADHYMLLDSGEIKEFNKFENRGDSFSSLRRTFRNMRALINTNVVNPENCKWITLTYRQDDGKPMTNSKKLYDDFKKFNMRFQYWLKKHSIPKSEYIVIMEPQGSGAWHAHLIYIWQEKAPYIHNDIIADLWSHGFTKTKKLDNVDNIGAYLTAYLGDMDLQEFQNSNFKCNVNKRFKIKEIDVDGQKKSYVKGARLHFYPPKFNMVRYSKGIKKPIISEMTEYDARKKVSAATLTFEKTLKLKDEAKSYESIINYRYYNKVRKNNQ